MKDYKTREDRLGESLKPFPDDTEELFSFDFCTILFCIAFGVFGAGILVGMIW